MSSPDNTSPKKASRTTRSPNPKSPNAKSSTQSSRSKKKSGRSTRIEDTYDYFDAEGTLLYQVVRFEPKAFRQRRPNPKGGWTWSLQDVERLPYLLPEMLEAIGEGQPILIVEGEKDVETALRMRSSLEASSDRFYFATTAPGGAGKWRTSFSHYFKGAHIWIAPDIDEAGFDHARQVAKHLRGVAESIKVLRLPSTEEHFDLSAWAESGGSAEDLLRLADQSPYLFSRAHPTHEIDFEAVPGPSASLKEIKEYLVSGGSVRSGQVFEETSPGLPPSQPPEEAKFKDEDPTWEKIGADISEWEGIGVEMPYDEGSLGAVLDSLDQIEVKSRNGAVGFSLPSTESEVSDSDIYMSEDSTSDSEPDVRDLCSKGTDPAKESDLLEEAAPSEEAGLLESTEPESITEALETPPSRQNGSRENEYSDIGAGKASSRENGTSRSSGPSFSSETRRVIRLLEEEGAEVLSAGGAFYLVFPFLSSTKSGSQKQAGEAHRPAISGKAYPLDGPLVVPLLLRLTYNRSERIPSPDACRAALLFLTPAVPSPAHVSSRVAFGNGAIYIDAGENTILEVKPGEWQARSSAPVLFLRSEYARPLPAPKKRGSLTAFRKFLQIEAGEAWIGIRGWLLGALCPTGPVPPLLLEGDDPRRLSWLATQLAFLLDPRSSKPLSQFQPLLSTCLEATADPSFWGLRQDIPFQEPPCYEEPRPIASPACRFICCLTARFLTKSPALPPNSENGGEHSCPLGSRQILVGSGPELRPELRKGLLAVRPTFLNDSASADPANLSLNSRQTTGSSEREARAEALGVLLNGAAEAMDAVGEMPLPEELRNDPHRAFLAWVAAAEAGLSPASLGSERYGPSSRPFVDIWRERHYRPGLLRRLVRTLRQWMQAET
ncbi:hypothetical protein [Salinibacter sp. 10B]|uniref:hypothetical protein n=1 Tax=Salinibacter sp. 10B TaxID=1923971 RepID=UPI0011B05F32|nr:hypothetical protein [Salinibacter sp. 10B]